MSGIDEGKQKKRPKMTDSVICWADPLARLLVVRLAVKWHTMGLAVLAWSVVYLFFWPAIFGCLRSSEGYLGSLDDWHAQLLLLLVFPAACAFYVWQPRAIARVYGAMRLGERSGEVGGAYRSRVWLVLSMLLAAAIVVFDGPKMIPNHGSFWMAENWLTILGREVRLAVAFYMISMMAWRQLVATVEWRRLLASPASAVGLKAASTYGLAWALLLALFGLRLSVEAIELPLRAGTITPDYYVKITTYVVGSMLCFFAPTWGAFRREGVVRVDQLVVWLELASIIALPLLGYLALKLALGL